MEYERVSHGIELTMKQPVLIKSQIRWWDGDLPIFREESPIMFINWSYPQATTNRNPDPHKPHTQCEVLVNVG